MKAIFLLVLLLGSAIAESTAQELVYKLLPGSLITTRETGISEPLSGSFTWVLHTPSFYVDSETFTLTSLSFNSQSFILTGTGEYHGNGSTRIGSQGSTAFNASVDWAGSSQNPWFIGSYDQEGSHEGPAVAPTMLRFPGVGIGQPNSEWYGDLVIHAQLVPEPSTMLLMLLGVSTLFVVSRKRLTQRQERIAPEQLATIHQPYLSL